MTFVQAISSSKWVRRRGWGSWLFVRREDPVVSPGSGRWRELTWTDLTATDWMAYEMLDAPDPDASEIRFSLLELE